MYVVFTQNVSFSLDPKSLCQMMIALEQYGTSYWLYLIPLYHMLTNAKSLQGENYLTPKWWRTDGFDELVQQFKNRER